ncbi:hypothetical protein CHS0354_003205 [Potamilus streckersoni]|uniref:Uncharacterized protein n=1 Tax=Potamilus streckersoni TaxID=2493646 RepID=A0AAE0VXJ9_9BIVA|nr:hypothetical protein CHS0354_003205 [Potamilus streckersoni]
MIRFVRTGVCLYLERKCQDISTFTDVSGGDSSQHERNPDATLLSNEYIRLSDSCCPFKKQQRLLHRFISTEQIPPLIRKHSTDQKTLKTYSAKEICLEKLFGNQPVNTIAV